MSDIWPPIVYLMRSACAYDAFCVRCVSYRVREGWMRLMCLVRSECEVKLAVRTQHSSPNTRKVPTRRSPRRFPSVGYKGEPILIIYWNYIYVYYIWCAVVGPPNKSALGWVFVCSVCCLAWDLGEVFRRGVNVCE